MEDRIQSSGASAREGGGKRWVRVVGLVLVLAAGAVLLWPRILEKRTERRVRAMLLSVQEGLQRYHVKEERYPKERMEGKALARLLIEGEHLAPDLQNPWTGLSYAGEEGEDWLRYRTDSLAETYELTVLSPGTEEAKFRLDSTKNQSLE